MSYSEDLSIILHCIDNRTGRVLVSKSYAPPKESRTEWIYTSATSEMLYPELLKTAYKEFIVDLTYALKGK